MAWDVKYEEEGRIWGDLPTDGAKLFAELLPENTKSILDVGCGYGRDSLYLASAGYQVTGIDSSKYAVDMASESAMASESNIEFLLEDCLDNSFLSENFDAVWSSNLLHLFSEEERHETVEEMERLLKPGGILGIFVLSTSDRDSDHHSAERKKPFHKFDRGELEKLLSTLDIIKLEEMDEEEIHSKGEKHHHIKWLAVAKKR